MMTEKSIRILLFSTAFRPFIGGSEIAIEEIAKRLPDINFDIITPRCARKLEKEEEFKNIRIFRVGWGAYIDKFLFPILGSLTARRLFRLYNYEIIHAYQASHAAGAAWLLKIFGQRFKLILTLQEGKNLEGQNFLINFFRNLIIKRADVITAISGYLRGYARRINKKAKIIVIPNGVDIGNFSKEPSYGELSSLKDRLGIKPDDKIIISVSRLVSKNGMDVLIDALSTLKKQRPELSLKLLIIGDGPEKVFLELQAAAYGLSDRVNFIGSINYSEVPKYLKIADLFVRPSRSEGLGSAFLEAMAAGVPIIGTKIGGIVDFLKDPTSGSGRATGLFAEIDNPEDLATKINLILSKRELAERLIKNAKDLVIEKYDWDKIAEQFRGLYLQEQQI